MTTTATAERLSEPAQAFLAREHGLGRERGLEGLGAYLETESVYVAL